MPNATTTKIDTITGLLTHLVRMPTVSTDPATNRAALEWIEQQLDALPLKISRFDNDGVPSLVATTTGTADPKNPRLWLAAHMDVVSGQPEDFEAKLQQGRLYGRGTHDMKFAIATYIALFQHLGQSLASYDLGLFITSDEEIGGTHGAGWLVNDRGYRGQAVLLPDSSTPWMLESGAKGIMWWQLTATGRTAHASKPWTGINAIDELMKFVDSVRKHFPAEPCGDPEHRHATFNLSTVVAANSTNQVPETAIARVDIRYTPDLDPSDIEGWFAQTAAAVPTVQARAYRRDDRPYQVKDHPAARKFVKIAHEVTGLSIGTHTAHGSSDARWFAWKGVPTINVGVTGSGYHTSPEWVDLKDVGRFYEITRRFIDDWAKITS